MAEQKTLTVNASNVSASAIGNLNTNNKVGYIPELTFDCSTFLPLNIEMISFSISIHVKYNSNGYNGTTAKIISDNYTFSSTWTISEPESGTALRTWTTTNVDDLTYLSSLLTSGSFILKLQKANTTTTGVELNSNNTPYITVVYAPITKCYIYQSGWKKTIPYIATYPAYDIDFNPKLERPSAAMTSNNSQNCVATSSTQYDDRYAAYKAFNKVNDTEYNSAWASTNSDSSPWIQIIWDIPLYNVSVKIANRTRSNAVQAPISGTISGLDASGTVIDTKAFSSRSTSSGYIDEYYFSNNTQGIQGIKIAITEHDKESTSITYCAINEIYIYGYKYSPQVPTWRKCEPNTYRNSEWI